MAIEVENKPESLYKFVGAPDADLPGLFEKIFTRGSMKFGSALHFNDPFEFKFATVAPPSRQAVDNWHDLHDPGRSARQRDLAWESFQGAGATVGWNTRAVPRRDLLSNMYVLCLAPTWDNPLLWAHYASMHAGFCVVLDGAALDVYAAHEAYGAMGSVIYRPDLPTVRWFVDPPIEKMAAAVFNKSDAWAYEEEFRVLFVGAPGSAGLFVEVDPRLMKGVVLGARAPQALIRAALVHQSRHPGFTVRQITSDGESYALRDVNVVAKVRCEAVIL